jgi:hypothetical protein
LPIEEETMSEIENNQVGKRYRCEQCGLGVMCAKAGPGRFTCHHRPMVMVSTKPLPSTD